MCLGPRPPLASDFVRGRRQLIRQINEVKQAMHEGTRLVLLDHDNLYESLYDVLNQRYAPGGAEGVGWCPVVTTEYPSPRILIFGHEGVFWK